MATNTQPITLELGYGSGRQTIPAWDGASTYLIKLAPGLTPDDVILVSDQETVAAQEHFSTSLGWGWSLRLKNSSDEISQSMGRGVRSGLLPVDAVGRPSGMDGMLSFAPSNLVGIQFDNGTTWDTAEMVRQMRDPGHINGPQLLGSSYSELLLGDGRDRTIYGFGGGDTIVAGAGNETLIGSGELRFNKGYGRDTVDTNYGFTDIVMGAGIDAAQVRVRSSGPDLVLQTGEGTQDVLTLRNFHQASSGPDSSEHGVRFANGEVWRFDDLFTRYFQTGSAGNDRLVATHGTTSLSGGAGNDRLDGYGQGESLYGGLGDDTLFAKTGGYDSQGIAFGTVLVDPGAGNDVVFGVPKLQLRFGRGFGQDILEGGGMDEAPLEVVFDADVRASDVAFYQVPTELWYGLGFLAVIKDTGDALYLPRAGSAGSPYFSAVNFKFAEGVTLKLADLMTSQDAIPMMSDKVAEGGSGADTLVSGVGEGVTLRGKGGSDTYVIKDLKARTVLDFSGAAAGDTQTIVIQGKFNPNDVRVSGYGTLKLSLIGTGAVVIPDQYTNGSLPALNIQFDDGTVWHAADLLARVDNSNGGTSSVNGNDVIVGSDLNDVFKLAPGQGQDTIQAFQNDASHTHGDVIALSTDDVSFSYYSEHMDSHSPGGTTIDEEEGLDIRFNATGEHVRVYDQARKPGQGGPYVISYPNDFLRSDQVVITMPGGKTLTGVALSALLARPEDLVGTALDDTLRGSAANDVLEGGRGDDTVIVDDLGGINDRDVVRFNRGDGQDQVVSKQGGYTLRLGVGISPDDVLFTLSGGIAIAGSADQINGDQPDRIEFANGVVWDAARIAAVRGTDVGEVHSFVGIKGADQLVGRGGADDISGLDGDDILHGGGGNDTLRGGAGSDQLLGDQGANVLIGGKGNDYLTVGVKPEGSPLDTVRFALGDGQDRVASDPWNAWPEPAYVLELGEGILPEDVSFTTNQWQDFFLRVGGGDKAVVDGLDGVLPSQIVFANGVVWDAAMLAQARLNGSPVKDYIQGGSGDDRISGRGGDDVLSGDTGRDTLEGGDGADTLQGDDGDDLLIGGAGADHYGYYLFESAVDQGHDTIRADNEDVIELSVTSVTASDLIIDPVDAGHPEQLTFGVKGFTPRITIDNIQRAQGLKVMSGDTLLATGAELFAKAKPAPLTLTGTQGRDMLTGKDGNDTLSGLGGQDMLAGGKGDDLLNGGKGNDLYRFAAGDGHDTIVDDDATWFNNDQLFISGIKSGQLWFTRSGNNLDISVTGGTDRVTVKDWFAGSSHVVERITAGDGKSLSSSKVQALVGAMASFSPTTGLPTPSPTAPSRASLDRLIATSWT